MKEQKLYVIRQLETGFCKIGISKNPDSRVKELQVASPYKLRVSLIVSINIGTAKRLEQELHDYFKKFRVSGEWFKDTSDEKIIIAIEKSNNNYSIKKI